MQTAFVLDGQKGIANCHKDFYTEIKCNVFCRSTAKCVRAMSMGEDHGGDRARGACAGVGEHDRVLCAVSSPYACGGLTEFVAFAGTPRREGGSAPCESVYVARDGPRR